MLSATQLRPGMVIKFNNELYSVFSMTHRTPGNLRGFVQAKMRSLRTGSMTEHRFSSEDKVEKAILDEQEMEYLYDDGEYFYFMNTENYEQMHLTKELLGDATDYLIPQLKVTVEFYEGKPISVELPATVDMTVVETEPGLKGATVSNVTKPAKMETGLVVQVPPFISEGEKNPRQYVRRHLSGKSLRVRKEPEPEASSSSGKTVLRSSTTRSRSIRAMIGGSLNRSRRSSATASSVSITIRQVGSACSGVAPPPITDSPSQIRTSRPNASHARASARSRISRAVIRIMRSAGTQSYSPSSMCRSVVSIAW